MNRLIRKLPAALLATTLVLASACSREPAAEPASDADDGGPYTALGRAVGKAMDEARTELERGNISLSSRDRDAPKGEITPEGDLLVGGRAVTITPAQRSLLLEYRGHVVAVASRGMDIGMQGADLAARAMGKALKGVVGGMSEADIERAIEAESGALQDAAHALCNRLPDMLASQRRLAEALPEFVPYATMTESDLEDCGDKAAPGSNGAPTPAPEPDPATEPAATGDAGGDTA